MTASSARVHLLILILLSGLVIGFNLGSNSLHNQDEAMHAVIAREAATQGNWLPLTYNDSPYFNKLPLRIWLTALTFKAAGTNEWTVRLWSAVLGLGTVLALYLVGRRLWGERTAFLSSLILLTSHQHIYNHCVRTGETDSMLIFCWTCALLLLQQSVEERNRRLLYVAAAFLGLCGMARDAMLAVHFLGRLRSPESSFFSALAVLVVLAALAALAYRLLGRLRDSIKAHLAEGEALNIRLPRRKSRHPRFDFYLGDKNPRIMRIKDLTPDAIPGELLLTDVATLEQIREAVPELELPDRPLAQAGGLLLLCLPD